MIIRDILSERSARATVAGVEHAAEHDTGAAEPQRCAPEGDPVARGKHRAAAAGAQHVQVSGNRCN